MTNSRQLIIFHSFICYLLLNHCKSISMKRNVWEALLLLLCALSVLSVEYSFYTRRDIKQLDSTVRSIGMPSDDRISILKGDNETTSITIASFSGTKYETAYFKNLAAPLLQASTYAYSNEGKMIRQFDLLGNRVTTYNLSKISSSNVMGNPEMLVFSYQDPCPTLMFLNTTSNQTKLKVYEQGSQCKFNNSGYIKMVKGGTYVYAIGNSFYILDANYQMKTRIVQQMSANQSYSSINVFVNPDTDMSTLALTSDQNHVYIFSEANQFQLSSRIYNPTLSLSLTSEATANSYHKNNVYRWRELKSPLVYMNTGTFCTAFSPIALLNNESLLVGGNQFDDAQQYRISLGVISTNNLISVKSYVSLNIEYSAIAHSGVTNSDDSILFLLLLSNQTKYRSVCKVSINDKKVQVIKDKNDASKDANCPAYGLINDDRLVTVCANGAYYQIQLRNANDLSIINQITLNTTQSIQDVRILTNYDWKDSIAVLIKNFNPSIEDDCLTRTYSIWNDFITINGYQKDSISFTRSWASASYIVTMKLSGMEDQYDDQLAIYSASNLALLKGIPYDRASESQKLYDILVHKHVLVVNSNIPPYQTQVYDLSKNIGNWLTSTFFKDARPLYGYGYFIFPTNSTLYEFSSCDGQPAKGREAVGIYNLAVNQISGKQSMGAMFKYNSIYPAKYLHFTPAMADDTCPLVIFASGITIYKFRDCEPYSAAESFTLTKISNSRPFNEFQYNIQSSIWPYLLISYFSPSHKVYKAQIRQLKSLDTVIWYQQSGVRINTMRFYVDSIVFTNNYGLKIYRVIQGQQSGDYSVNTFTLLDANAKRCVTFAGVLSAEPSQTRLFFKRTLHDISNISVDVNSTSLTILSIDQNCEYLAYYDGIKVAALKIANTELVRTQQYAIDEVTNIQLRASKLIMRTKKQFVIKHLNSSYPTSESTRQSVDTHAAIDAIDGQGFYFSADASMAVRHDNSTFQVIATNGSKLIDFYNITDERVNGNYDTAIITGVGFTPTNKLYMSYYIDKPNMMNLFLFYPKQCDSTQIKVNLHCGCDAGFIPKDQGCVCVSGYNDSGRCLDCSFPCSQCYGPGMKCNTYSPWFYVIIAIIALLVLATAGFIIFKIKQRNKNRGKSLFNEESLQREKTLMTSQHEIE